MKITTKPLSNLVNQVMELVENTFNQIQVREQGYTSFNKNI